MDLQSVVFLQRTNNSAVFEKQIVTSYQSQMGSALDSLSIFSSCVCTHGRPLKVGSSRPMIADPSIDEITPLDEVEVWKGSHQCRPTQSNRCIHDPWVACRLVRRWQIWLEKGIHRSVWNAIGDRQDCTYWLGITLISVPGKVLAYLLFLRLYSQLLKLKRSVQSRFMSSKSTTDHFLELFELVEWRREFRQGMFAPSDGLTKEFDSVHREALSDLLGVRGILARIVDLLPVLRDCKCCGLWIWSASIFFSARIFWR